jgi:hypothetical protein
VPISSSLPVKLVEERVAVPTNGDICAQDREAA